MPTIDDRTGFRYAILVAGRRRTVKFCALLWFAAGAWVCPWVAWAEPFVSTDGCFSAELSPTTQYTSNSSPSPVGEIITSVFLDRQPGRFLTVSFTDLPKLALLGGRETIFEEARNGMLQQCGGTPVSWVRQDRQTRRLFYQVQGQPAYRGETLFRLDRCRLYVVDVRSEAHLPVQADRHFLSSFKVLPPAAAAAAPLKAP